MDEFQDVNYARQQLIWLLAGKLAKVMVVGDDDQCVYEWLGARAVYLTRVFREKFNAHPHAVYHLSRSFRFGPAIAQSAANVIAHNTDRAPKRWWPVTSARRGVSMCASTATALRADNLPTK